MVECVAGDRPYPPAGPGSDIAAAECIAGPYGYPPLDMSRAGLGRV